MMMTALRTVLSTLAWVGLVYTLLRAWSTAPIRLRPSDAPSPAPSQLIVASALRWAPVILVVQCMRHRHHLAPELVLAAFGFADALLDARDTFVEQRNGRCTKS